MKMLPKITPLLPCPFCGSAAAHVTVSAGGDMGTKVRYKKCHVATRFLSNRAAGAKAWNIRSACLDDSRGLTARLVGAKYYSAGSGGTFARRGEAAKRFLKKDLTHPSRLGIVSPLKVYES